LISVKQKWQLISFGREENHYMPEQKNIDGDAVPRQNPLGGLNRREFMAAAGTVLTSSLFTGNIKGANDRVTAGFIGVGKQGMTDFQGAIADGVEPIAFCDVYQPTLEASVAAAAKAGKSVKAVKDFRDVLADKSIDFVCIATPDHWHAYMMIEACKAGKDVYVEKPVATTVDESRKMVEAARKYKRAVQVGTMRRSWDHSRQACDLVRSGGLGQVTFARTWSYGLEPPESLGNPPNGNPPPGLDWDMWLGPAPMRPFNQNRFGVRPGKGWSSFRFFWDYAGGQLTDVCMHVLDLVHMAMGEPVPIAVTGIGTKQYIKDNRETPDTQLVTLQYPGFISASEVRFGNAQTLMPERPMAGGMGFSIHGDKATLQWDMAGYRVIPEGKPYSSVISGPPTGPMGEPPKVTIVDGDPRTQKVTHWRNFLDCIKSRERPIADIEYGARSTIACLLGNIATRAKIRIDYDDKTGTALQKEARPFMSHEYRKPWKLEV
jgi:predicted dehydrogenase